MARRPDLEIFAKEHDIKIGTIADLIHYRMMNEKTVERKDVRHINTEFGTFDLYTYEDTLQGHSHLALTMGEWNSDTAVPVRVQLCDPIRDMLAVAHDDSPHWSVRKAMQTVSEAGQGVVVLLADPALHQNLAERVTALFHEKPAQLPQTPDGTHVYSTIGTGSQILRDLGVCNMRLMSAPMKFSALSGFDLHVVEYIDCK
jgi:3,4-dihydroxy 2-butanone 4-phosphate synthase/GTP cyclohydrolase II